MANQNANADDNQTYGLLGHSGTQERAETRKIVVVNGAVLTTAGAYPINSFNNIQATYPSGTQEVYTYQLGTSPVGTITTNYTDTTKNNISSILYA